MLFEPPGGHGLRMPHGGASLKGFVRGEEPAIYSHLRHCREYGMELEFLSRERYRQVSGSMYLIRRRNQTRKNFYTRRRIPSRWSPRRKSHDGVSKKNSCHTYSTCGWHSYNPCRYSVWFFGQTGSHSHSRFEEHERHTRSVKLSGSARRKNRSLLIMSILEVMPNIPRTA